MNLRQLQESGPIPLRRALEIMAQLCEALADVHAAGVVHRDLKPDNIVVMTRDGQDFVKLLDFGVAKLKHTSKRRPTRPGTIVGTAEYMSPEQAAGCPVDLRSDLYAVGAILFELTTGRVPFQADTLRELLASIAVMYAPPLGELTRLPAAVADDLEEIVFQCLQKDPAHRPQSAGELLAALTPLIAKLRSDRGRPEQPPAKLSSPPRRGWLASAVAAALALALWGSTTTWQDAARRALRAAAPAPAESVGPRETPSLGPGVRVVQLQDAHPPHTP
jgi:serine/threonine-protein kinase